MSLKGIKQSLIICGFVFGSHLAIGQLAEQPLQQSLTKPAKGKSAARTQSFPPLSLPFWDDFSFRTPGYPDSLWTEYASVTISDGVAIRPPTIYTATFDGLKADGTPYDPNDKLATGYTDVLTSQLIKMTEVPASERGTVYFSFFYQWRGNGEAPDDEDYLAIEFLDQSKNWVEIDRIVTDGSLNQSVFYPKIYPVTAAFFHDEFQFRFRSHGKVSGPYDIWNVDYVFLAQDRDAADIFFPDQAVNTRLFPLFGKYTSIPVAHFFDSAPAMITSLGMNNVKDSLDTYTLYLQGEFANYKDSNRVVTSQSLTPDASVDITKGVIAPLTAITLNSQSKLNPTNPAQFDPLADSIFISIRAIINTGDVADSAGLKAADYRSRYIPTDFRANDTTRSTFVLKDYYAYDDGTADFSAHLTNEGNRLAYQFDMLTDEVDTLVGFRAYFPFYGGQASILDVFVLGDDNGLPGPLLASRFNVTLQKNGENRFMDFLFEPTLVSNKFYVGWEEPPTRVYVGLDKNNDTGDKIFVNTNGFWVPNTNVTGSLMIRPIFGSGDIVTGIENPDEPITLYPNPNNGSFHFDKGSRIIAIQDLAGRPVIFKSQQNDDDQFVSLQSPASGIYIVRSIRNKKISSQKIVVY